MSTKKILQDITEVVVDAVVWVEVVSRIEVAVEVGYPDLALQA